MAAERYGVEELAARAAVLLETGDEDPDFLRLVGGPPAEGVLDGSWPRYWAQSWGARVLERYWTASAARPVIAGLAHEHWRVRMICARLCTAHELGVPERLVALCEDENWRVRDAAVTALGAVGEGEHADALRALLDDENATVRGHAEHALVRMTERLDRPLRD